MSKSKRRKAKKMRKVHKAGQNAAVVTRTPETVVREQDSMHPVPASELLPLDAQLLERARIQWQFGDWESLAALDAKHLDHHPDRARLALLAAAGHAQQGDQAKARELTRAALEWGANRRLVGQILISGVYNTLGRMAALTEREERALPHFETAVGLGVPGGTVPGLARARAIEQLERLRLPIKLQALFPFNRVDKATSLPRPAAP